MEEFSKKMKEAWGFERMGKVRALSELAKLGKVMGLKDIHEGAKETHHFFAKQVPKKFSGNNMLEELQPITEEFLEARGRMAKTGKALELTSKLARTGKGRHWFVTITEPPEGSTSVMKRVVAMHRTKGEN